jgi:ParB family chromosome partitioning protein
MRSRCDFDEDKLITLAYSVKKYGMLEPICVRETEPDDSYAYEVVMGERRLRAAKLAGSSSIPCIIVDIDQATSAEMSIIENIFTEPLNYFEVAAALQRISEFEEDSLDEIASRLFLPQSELSKKLWLLELDYKERQMLLNMNVPEDIAVSIARISDKDRRLKLIEAISANDMSESTMKDYIADIEKCSSYSSRDLPRDVASVLKGLSSKLKFLNRHKKRAEMKILNNADDVTVEIKIKP